MLDDEPIRDDGSAEELLRRALLDDSSAVAVSLCVNGLPLSEAMTVIFHGRRDLGTLQTYVACGSRSAGATVSANELLRVPCDLDLADAGDREEAERLYVEQATALSSPSITRSSSRSGCPPTGCCPPPWWPPTHSSSSPRCAAPGLWPTAGRRWG
jgi:hypothetical protein